MFNIFSRIYKKLWQNLTSRMIQSSTWNLQTWLEGLCSVENYSHAYMEMRRALKSSDLCSCETCARTAMLGLRLMHVQGFEVRDQRLLSSRTLLSIALDRGIQNKLSLRN